MRGSPLRRALAAFFLILTLVGYPLWRMTSEGQAAPTPVAPKVAGPREIQLQLASTTPPKSVKVLHLGKVIWEESAPVARMERTLQLAYPEEGVDLRFQIEWPADVPLAGMRVRLTDPAGTEHEKSIWGEGSAEEVLTFP